MKTSRAKITLIALGALGIVAAGCSSPVSGTPQPDKPASSAATPKSGNPFAARNQCALLDQILTGQGFPKATPTVAQPERACASQKPSVGTERGMDVSLFLQEDRLYTDTVPHPETARRGDINGRPSIEEPEPQNSPGQCDITMAVEPHSRASLLVTTSLDTKTACAAAEKYATAVEPLLPKN
ncbi:DUF3558 family protein [Amycolatopsis sp. NPDC004079]|uniref:DUF3558 family protein n=1 Tax=Amycolatopsis sp. NPDC004079 TaxID=3154549 RepID=UPI0033ADD50C